MAQEWSKVSVRLLFDFYIFSNYLLLLLLEYHLNLEVDDCVVGGREWGLVMILENEISVSESSRFIIRYISDSLRFEIIVMFRWWVSFNFLLLFIFAVSYIHFRFMKRLESRSKNFRSWFSVSRHRLSVEMRKSEWMKKISSISQLRTEIMSRQVEQADIRRKYLCWKLIMGHAVSSVQSESTIYSPLCYYI